MQQNIEDLGLLMQSYVAHGELRENYLNQMSEAASKRMTYVEDTTFNNESEFNRGININPFSAWENDGNGKRFVHLDQGSLTDFNSHLNKLMPVFQTSFVADNAMSEDDRNEVEQAEKAWKYVQQAKENAEKVQENAEKKVQENAEQAWNDVQQAWAQYDTAKKELQELEDDIKAKQVENAINTIDQTINTLLQNTPAKDASQGGAAKRQARITEVVCATYNAAMFSARQLDVKGTNLKELKISVRNRLDNYVMRCAGVYQADGLSNDLLPDYNALNREIKNAKAEFADKVTDEKDDLKGTGVKGTLNAMPVRLKAAAMGTQLEKALKAFDKEFAAQLKEVEKADQNNEKSKFEKLKDAWTNTKWGDLTNEGKAYATALYGKKLATAKFDEAFAKLPDKIKKEYNAVKGKLDSHADKPLSKAGFGVATGIALLTLPIAAFMILNVTKMVSVPKLSTGSLVGDITAATVTSAAFIIAAVCAIASGVSAFKKEDIDHSMQDVTKTLFAESVHNADQNQTSEKPKNILDAVVSDPAEYKTSGASKQ